MRHLLGKLKRWWLTLSWPAVTGLVLLAGTVLVVGDAALIEPRWIKVTYLHLDSPARHRFAFITDLHYTGDAAQLRRAAAKLRRLQPEFLLFGGDLAESGPLADAAARQLAALPFPVYMVPGNHDWGELNLARIDAVLRTGGGALLQDATVSLAGGDILVTGVSGWSGRVPVRPPLPRPGSRRVFLSHFPAYVALVRGGPYDLALAGHSHGGQVRLPFRGALILPEDVGPYDKGYFPQTPAGPLYVNPGIGYWYTRLRFLCRPEITVIECGPSGESGRR